jgi:ubiquitin-protein ligase
MEKEMEIDLENFTTNSFPQNDSNQRNNTLFDINMNDDTYKKQESISFSDEKNTIENTNSIIEDITILGKFNYRRTSNASSHNISVCERRLIKDLEELKKNENIGKFCKIIVHDYTKIQDSYNFEMIIEFVNYCSVKFIFPSDYPFVPPIISYHSGNRLPNLFDSEGNVILENAKESNWTPILWLSTLVNSIELLISECSNNTISKKRKYGKRKWGEYLNSEKSENISDLTRSIKKK